jgi:peptidoglycan/xylan/chitin deacetylase (PgdA/CDA1 family)
LASLHGILPSEGLSLEAMFEVTLSFDNGPEPAATPAVLDILRQAGVVASFFVLGHKLADPQRRALAARAAAEGHWIGNHTYTHTTPLGELAEPDVAAREIGRTEALIGDLACPVKLFRPFGRGGVLGPHLLSPAVLDYLKVGAYTVVLWSAIPRDWEDVDGWPDRALAQAQAQPRSLIVLHDLPTGAMAHLPRFIDAVRAAGGRFRQDFPPDCTPLVGGRETAPIAPYVAGLPSPAASGTPRAVSQGD